MLRIALVTETYPPEINGVALTVARMTEGLRKRGHRIQLIRPRQPDEARSGETGEDLLTVIGLRLPMYPQLQLGLPARHRLRTLWQRQRPDLVHIVTEGPLGRSALGLAKRLGLPVVAGFHTNFHRYSAYYGLAFLRGPVQGYLRRFHNRCALNLVPTAELTEELARLGVHNLHVLARGVDTERFNPCHRCRELRREWGADDADPVALYVGRLAPEKNLLLLACAFAAMRAANPRLRLVLVGDGPSAAGLSRLHPELMFRGMRTGADLTRHYASADLFLFPSLTETFGNVVTMEPVSVGNLLATRTLTPAATDPYGLTCYSANRVHHRTEQRMLFGIREEDIAYYGLIFGLTGLMGFMCFIIYKIGRESKAGKFGMFALFIVLGLGMVGFVAKSIIARWLGI